MVQGICSTGARVTIFLIIVGFVSLEVSRMLALDVRKIIA
jgi:hypothetical protein